MVDHDLEETGATYSEPVPAAMSRGCELEQEKPAALGRQSFEATTTVETDIEQVEAVSDVPKVGSETSTQLKELLPSQPEVGSLELLPAHATSPTSTQQVLAPQHTHIHYDLTGASVNIIRDSNVSEAQLSLVANPLNENAQMSEGPKTNSQQVNTPNDLSLVFAKACREIAKCLKEEDKLDELILIIMQLTCDTTEMLLPEAHTAKTVFQLFKLATQPGRRMWHYLDYDFLIWLLDTVESEKAKRILQDYDEHLSLFCEEELSALIPYKESPVKPTKAAWMEVKWKGDKAKFKLGNLYKCKEFLVKHLKIPRTSFVFDDAIPGCITLRWVILDGSAYPAIETKLCTGCIQFEFLNAEMEIKVVHPVKSQQRMHHTSNEVGFVLDECSFGNTEYSFHQFIPEHAKCPVCLGIVQNAVVSDCCCAAFCLNCYEETKKGKSNCPLCRCADFQCSKSGYIDKHVVGNLSAKCSRCEWIGCLSDAASDKCHPCLLGNQTSSEVLQEKPNESLEPISKEIQVQASVLSEVLPAEDQFVSDFNEKLPLLQMMRTLRTDIQAVQMYINDDHLSSHSGDPSVSAAAEAFRTGMDDITALLQAYEETFFAAEHSIASCPDGQLPISQSELANHEHDEQQSGLDHTSALPSQPNQQFNEAAQEAMATPPVPTQGSLLQKPTLAQTKLKSSTGTPLMGPLHLACWHGMHAKVRKLVEEGADINALGMFGMTPLIMAMFRGHAEVVSELISMGADADIQSDIGLSALQLAGAMASSSEALSMQLHAKATLVREVRRLLQLAVTAGDALLVEQLIRSTNINPDYNTHTGQSLLIIACQQGYANMTEKLLSLGASAHFPSATGKAPLHGASYSGSLPCLTLLLEKHVEVNVHDVSGDTPLHTATRQSHAEVVRELLNHDCAVNCTDYLGRTPMHFAAQRGNCRIVALLHQSGASLDAVDHRGFTPVHVAVTVGNADAVKELLDAGANPNLPTMDLGLTPLHSAVRKKGGKAIIRLLHQAKANVAARDHKGRGLLYHAVRSGSIEIVQSVLSLGCPIDEVAPAKAASEKLRSAEHELQHPEYSNTDEDDDLIGVYGMHSGDISPLHLAILLGYVDIVEFLIASGADVHKVSSTGFTAIHMAVRNGNPHLIRQMVAEGCNPNQKTHDGFAPLHLAAQWGHKDAAMMLIRAGCNKEIQTGSNQKPQTLTALLIAAKYHQTDLARILIDEGCQVQATNADNSNAIHLAVIGLESVKPWKRQNHNYNLPDPYQQFPVGYPSNRSSDACETTKLMVDHGCNINAVNSDGLTPLDLLQNMKQNLKVHAPFPHFGYDPKYAEIEELYTFMRHCKALTSPEIQRQNTVAATLSHMKTNAEDIEVKLKAPQKHLPKYAQEQEYTDVLNRPPSSYDLARFVVPRASRLWYEIGEHLDIHLTLLELALAQCGGDRQECCKRVLGFWLQGAGKHPITWRTVLDALRGVGEGALADSVVQQLQNLSRTVLLM